jgi:hypothetical protein
LFEMIESFLPKAAVVIHPVEQRGECAGLGGVVGLAPAVSGADEAGVFEDTEVFGDGGLGDAGGVGEHADGLFAVAAEAFEEGATGGVGKRFEEGVGGGLHQESITIWLWVGG